MFPLPDPSRTAQPQPLLSSPFIYRAPRDTYTIALMDSITCSLNRPHKLALALLEPVYFPSRIAGPNQNNREPRPWYYTRLTVHSCGLPVSGVVSLLCLDLGSAGLWAMPEALAQ